MIELLNEPGVTKNLISSVILFLVLFTIRIFSFRAIRKAEVPIDARRKWIVQIKNTTTILLFLGLFFVWGTELRTFALSVVALAAAIVIATKELILCFLGGILKALTRPFKLGDRIEIATSQCIRGDVISHNFLTTTLLEIGPGKSAHMYTGKYLTIPNSVFLSNAVFNETKSAKYGLHTFSIFRPNSIDINLHKKIILFAAKEICSPYTKEAEKYLKQIKDIEGLELPTVDPRVYISFPNHDKVELIIRIPIESLRAGRIEQAIIQKYIDLISDIPNSGGKNNPPVEL